MIAILSFLIYQIYSMRGLSQVEEVAQLNKNYDEKYIKYKILNLK